LREKVRGDREEEEMMGLGLIGGLIGFVISLFCFIALMSIWGASNRTAKAVEELRSFKRIENGLDPKTGKAPKQ